MAQRKIGMEDLDGFSIDEETRQLYWRGRAVVTEMSLPWWVQVAAIAASVSTVVIATASVISLLR